MAATYASSADLSKGRLYEEQHEVYSSIFRADCDRVIHSKAFRRMEYKTQVFVNHEGDYYRNRLTHSLEVAQVGKSLARALNLEEDLTEILCLAHDLGHPPFGHIGEATLNELSKDSCGFNHNIQTFKIVTQLEESYPLFNGLNLSWEALEGLVKHNGPLIGPHCNKAKHPEAPHRLIKDFQTSFNLQLDEFPSLEAQIASLADDIAYDSHDIEDGLRAGFFTLEDLQDLPLLSRIIQRITETYPNILKSKLIHEMRRRMIDVLAFDVIKTTKDLLDVYHVQTPNDVRATPVMLASFSENIEVELQQVKTFLHERMYAHPKISRMRIKAQHIITSLFDVYSKNPECLPESWLKKAKASQNIEEKTEVIVDFIAGMTDRYAIEAYKQLFDIEIRT